MGNGTWDLIQVAAFVLALTGLTPLLGGYMARVFNGQRTFLDPVLLPVERWFYRLAGVDSQQEMTWKQYAGALLVFNALGLLAAYLIQRMQGILPLNPEHLPAVSPGIAFNTAASFVTNTNWQAYAAETTMSYLTQMAALTVQNFLSAATGIAVAIAFIRGLARRNARGIGNFWFDLTRSVLWILLPLSLLLALVLVSQGVVQTLTPYHTVTTLEGETQRIAVAPAASQEAIKVLGTNGGGIFSANSSHPFENPTPLTNFLEVISILSLSAGLTYTLGKMVGDTRQGWVLYGAMLILFLAAFALIYQSELAGNPQLAALGLTGPTALEGKEIRFGIGNTALFATVTTAASSGAVNGMHDSLTPLGGLVTLTLMMLGEVVFGGVGSGLYGILLFVIVTVFIVGLMVGRTPEYLGKKIEPFEMKMATIGVLIPGALILIGTAIAAVLPAGKGSILNPGPHGLSEILYAFTSTAANNGSAFAGLNAATPFYTLYLGFQMILGRFGVILPVLAIAGHLAAKKAVPAGPGTFPTTGGLLAGLLAGVIVLVGALTFLPALALGPIVEHLLMWAGQAF
ncbi:MAG: potassium-transporting ATPase subunit KdpA [Bacteroidota bacterium]